MKWLLFFLVSFPGFSQETPNPEIFLFDISVSLDSLIVTNGANISQNEGYDNQPSFYSRDTLIFSGTRDGQTDIVRYSLVNNEKIWLSTTNMGSEYSPQHIFGGRDIAAVRLDTTGLQRLYQYNWETGESSLLLPELKVGYFAFYDQNFLLTAVLVENAMDLVLNDLENKTSKTLVRKVGRSLHKVPETNSMSYTVMNEEGTRFDLFLLDLDGEDPLSFYLCTLPKGVSDYVWLDQNKILLGRGSELWMYDILGESQWKQTADLAEFGLDNISRLTVNNELTKLALAADSANSN